jgi:hypothetical protein
MALLIELPVTSKQPRILAYINLEFPPLFHSPTKQKAVYSAQTRYAEIQPNATFPRTFQSRTASQCATTNTIPIATATIT